MEQQDANFWNGVLQSLQRQNGALSVQLAQSEARAAVRETELTGEITDLKARLEEGSKPVVDDPDCCGAKNKKRGKSKANGKPAQLAN